MQGKTAHQPGSCLGGGSAEHDCDDEEEDDDENYREDNTYRDVNKEVGMLMG